MSFKNLRARIGRVLREYGFSGYYEQAEINDAGLLMEEFETAKPEENIKSHLKPKIEPLRPINSDAVVVQAIQPASKTESIEKMQEGFNRLIGQLENINSHLKDQIDQQQVLMRQMNKLPELLNGLPAMAANQSKLTEQLMEELKSASKQNEQVIETLEKIPEETEKQTECLNDINHQLTAAAAVDVQMGERFQRFNIAIDKLNETSMMHAESINQMGRTFAASDRYMKYLIQRQSTRFTWIFVATAGVCLAVIGILAGIIIYLRQ
jgi:chromosome segregation ATPase